MWKDDDETVKMIFSANIVRSLIFVNYDGEDGFSGASAKLLIPLANGLVYLLR